MENNIPPTHGMNRLALCVSIKKEVLICARFDPAGSLVMFPRKISILPTLSMLQLKNLFTTLDHS